MKKYIFLFFLPFLLLSSPLLSSPLIRVKILQASSLILHSTTSLRVKGEEFSFPLTLRVSPEGISTGEKVWTSPLQVSPQGEGFLTVEGRKYRGKLVLLQVKNYILVLNELPLEEYLWGVIKREISPSWPQEAVKAQAVVARTYALNKWEEFSQRGEKNLWLENTVIHQVYGGVESEDPLARKAVNLTKGEVIVWEGKPIKAYYSACCGGEIASSKDVWGEDLPYSESKFDPYCSESPYYQWELKIKVKELKRILENEGIRVEKIYRLEPVSRDPGGRVKEIKIYHRGGEITMRGEELRKFLGVDNLKSTLFEVIRWAEYFWFRGRGWGHGVGMCQWGAKKMAEEGYSYKEILQFYYPGTKIVRWY